MKQKSFYTKKIVMILILMSLLLPSAAQAKVQTISSLNAYFVKTSDTTAYAYAKATCPVPSDIQIKLTLESKKPGESVYSQATPTLTKSKNQAFNITVSKAYGIRTDFEYRVKIEVTDTYNGKTTINKYYRYLEEGAGN